jgi:hypothetical protein
MGWTRVLVLLTLFISQVRSQDVIVLEMPADARTIALGQATVADINGLACGLGNPAIMSNIHGLSAWYQDRGFNYFNYLGDYRLRTAGISVQTTVGSFSFCYRRFDMGVGEFMLASGPEMVSEAKLFEYIAALSYARQISNSITLGATCKIYDHGYDLQWGSYKPSTTPAYLLDVGILFQPDPFFPSDWLIDKLQIGTSIENFGSDAERTFGVVEKYQLPMYWRIGFSWRLAVQKKTDFEFLRLILDGEYRSIFKSDYYDTRHRDFWGVGMEFRLLTLVAVRIGEEIQPYDDVFGKSGQWNMRYGIGIKLAPQQFGFPVPFSISFDYAVVPLYDGNAWFGPLERNQVKAFTIALSYDSPLF